VIGRKKNRVTKGKTYVRRTWEKEKGGPRKETVPSQSRAWGSGKTKKKKSTCPRKRERRGDRAKNIYDGRKKKSRLVFLRTRGDGWLLWKKKKDGYLEKAWPPRKRGGSAPSSSPAKRGDEALQKGGGGAASQTKKKKLPAKEFCRKGKVSGRRKNRQSLIFGLKTDHNLSKEREKRFAERYPANLLRKGTAIERKKERAALEKKAERGGKLVHGL